MFRILFLSFLVIFSLFADETDDLLDGFDELATMQEEDALLDGFDDEESEQIGEDKSLSWVPNGIEGKFVQSMAYSFHNDAPHDGLSSLKSLLFLEYNRELFNGFKLKVNGNTFYDFSYLIKGRDEFYKEDVDELESEVELFDAYIEGEISDNFDIKVGRQVVVWGKSDSIRITDVLNPLDNRRPAMVDIEDLRLPSAMVKFDFYHDEWKISPIMIVEQRFNKNPPFGGDFNPSKKILKQDTPDSFSYALNVAGEFSGFDIDFYLADIYAQDELGLPLINHNEKIKMIGSAFNYVYESWLLKGEVAYKKDFQFLQSGSKKFDRIDTLLGLEYKGIADTTLSYDIANKHMSDKSKFFEQDSYQHAFRVTSDFYNSTLHANYLIALFGKKLDEGGFQRVWLKYDIADGVSTNFGLVDYIGGNKMFDAIDDNDMLFLDLSYSF